MKKIFVAVLLIIAAGGLYVWMDNTESNETDPASSLLPEEGMGEVTAPPASSPVVSPAPVSPTPTAPAPSPAPAKDDMENVDPSPVPAPKIFNITGRNFSFSTSEIRVKKGDQVTINFESTDGFHDWVVQEFGAVTARVNTGGKTSVTFTADKSGTFEYYCSVSAHRAAGMKGQLIVE